MKLAEQFFKLFAPSICLKCGSEGSLLCAWCAEEALPPVESRCYGCNMLTEQFQTCPACRRKSPLKHLWVHTEYSSIAKELVQTMKFKYATEAADIISEALMNTIPALPNGTIIVHVPTATAHVRQRGYDHARRIATVLSKGSGLDFAPALARLGQSRQVGAKRLTRLTQLEDAFRVSKPYLIKDAPVLLVDDVVTTGATLEAAAKALKAEGVKSVDAIVFARAN